MQREHSMLYIAERLEAMVEEGAYETPRLRFVADGMPSDDLVSLYSYTDNLEIKSIVREVLEGRGWDPDTGEPDPAGKPVEAETPEAEFQF